MLSETLLGRVSLCKDSPPHFLPFVTPFSLALLFAPIVKSALYNNLTSHIHSQWSKENPIASPSVCPGALYDRWYELQSPKSPTSPCNPPSVNNGPMFDKRKSESPLKCYKGLMCHVRCAPSFTMTPCSNWDGCVMECNLLCCQSSSRGGGEERMIRCRSGGVKKRWEGANEVFCQTLKEGF